MTMTVELGALEPIVEELVTNGRYGSKSEVLRAGVRLVQEREARLAQLLAKLQVGIEAADRGDLFDIDDVFDELARRYEDPKAA